MAQVQVLDFGKTATVIEKTPFWVKTKNAWGDEWKLFPFMQPITAVHVAGPSVSTARLVWKYGDILREDGGGFLEFDPFLLDGQYVQIGVSHVAPPNWIPAAEEVPLWTGVIATEKLDVHGTELDPQGDQELVAYGLEHLLDRDPIGSAVALGEESGDFREIGHSPTFNQNYERGGSEGGNRTLSEEFYDGKEINMFSRDGALWTAKDILIYILHVHGLDDINFRITGQVDLLDNIIPKFSAEGLTVKQVIDKLINRKRGMGWCIRVPSEAYPFQNASIDPQVHIFSVIGEAVTVPGGLDDAAVSVSANPEQIKLVVDDTRDIQVAIVARDASPKYRKLEIRGELFKCCFNMSFDDDNMERVWNTATENGYKLVGFGDDTKTAKDNDAARKIDSRSAVYQKFRIPVDWDGTAKDSFGGTKLTVSDHIVVPQINYSDMSIDTENAQVIWFHDKKFERIIPIKKDEFDDATEPEYLAPIVLVSLPDDEETFNLHHVEKPAQGLPKSYVRMADRELSVILKAPINHSFGKNHFDDGEAIGPTLVQPTFDYEDLHATVFMKTDQRVGIDVDIPDDDSFENQRTLRIMLEDAELWYVAPDTVIGVDDDKQPKFHTGGVTKDDRPRLRAVAAFAKAWYSHKRSVVEVTRRVITKALEVGAYVVDISTGKQTEEAGTVVTEQSWAFNDNESKFRTSYWELDFTVMTDLPGFSDLQAAARQIKKIEARVERLEAHVGNMEVRRPVPEDCGCYVGDGTHIGDEDGIDRTEEFPFDELGFQVVNHLKPYPQAEIFCKFDKRLHEEFQLVFDSKGHLLAYYRDGVKVVDMTTPEESYQMQPLLVNDGGMYTTDPIVKIGPLEPFFVVGELQDPYAYRIRNEDEEYGDPTNYEADATFLHTLSDAQDSNKRVFVEAWYESGEVIEYEGKMELRSGELTINSGADETTSANVTLDNDYRGPPDFYRASEDPDFGDTSWAAYATGPAFALSSGYELKTVYFEVAYGPESGKQEILSTSDTIDFVPLAWGEMFQVRS